MPATPGPPSRVNSYIFFTMVLPLIRPALATLGILTFLDSWNNLLWPLIVIQSPNMDTIPLGLTQFSTLYSTERG